MLNKIIAWSLAHRPIVLALAAMILVYGGLTAKNLPVDVFPDLNRPVVTIMTETEGLAPEEVETLVTLPIETSMNGATGVERVRSSSAPGLSIVYVEFGWGTNIYIDRQIVNEKLAGVSEQMPEGITPQLAPISSIMGEIMLISVSSKSGQTDPLELRSIADWVIRPRLLSVSGVSQVIAIGGGRKQFQVLIDPAKLRQFRVSVEEVRAAVAGSNVNTTGGFIDRGGKEFLVRNLGRVQSADDIRATAIESNAGVPITVSQVADVVEGAQIKRGDGSANGRPAVIMSVQKQPGANTLELTEKVERAIQEVRANLPKDIVINDHQFRQSEFIESSIHNVFEALRDAGILVTIVLFLFLLNFRTTFITITAIPLSFLVTAIVFKQFDISVNTMTLGGLAVAIGELVDDAIVDIENVFRRLRENHHAATPRPALQVIYEASREVRNSIVFATFIVALVFVPLFALSGMEGRLFAPLAIAYIVALFASLFVSLTVTPVLASYLLPKSKAIAHQEKDSWLVRQLKARDEKLLRWTLRHPKPILVGTALLFLGAVATTPFLGKEFLPPFNEGSYVVNLLAQPGTSLEESNRLGTAGEKLLLTVPEVKEVGRRTGRAELDEHAEGVHYSEIDVSLKPEGDRSKAEVLAAMREKLAVLPGVSVSIGQPISHRLDHLLSGVRAQLAVKIFGTDLPTLRAKAEEVRATMASVPGVVDLNIEKLVEIPQVQVKLNRDALARYGLQSGAVSETLETAMLGQNVGTIVEGQRSYDLVVRFNDASRSNIEAIRGTLIDTPAGAKIPLSSVADISEGFGPNAIARENVQRRIVISANVAGRDLNSVVTEIQTKVKSDVPLSAGYFVEYGGQFEAQQSASRLIMALSVFSLVAIFLLLQMALGHWIAALQVMVNIPLAIIGGVIAVFLTGGVLSIASLIGFISLFGITSRNGIMMISHYQHLMKEEGEEWTQEMIVRGSLERLVPVMMTALTAGLALIPIAIAAGQPGKEILQPLAVVVLGGLVTSTLLDQVVTPALFWKYGKPVGDKAIAERESHNLAVERGLLPRDPDAHLFDDLLQGIDLDGVNHEAHTDGVKANGVAVNGANGHSNDAAKNEEGADETAPEGPPLGRR
ncbi:MAG: CusA/CzcA family heavy metal efflux RND transporter [Armatimonadetes bacterium]|nr:CusA/CzcA family heavy metal efflux RND transporter [Armatimonadota bacterium]